MDNTIRRVTSDEKLILFRDFKAIGVNSVLRFGIHRDRITRPRGRPGVPEHTHRNAVEINFQTEGRQRYFIEDAEYNFKPGTVYVIAPDTVHGSRGYAKERGLTYYLVLDAHADFLNYDRTTAHKLRSYLAGIGTNVFRGGTPLRRLFERLVSACETMDDRTPFIVRSIVTDIILETYRCSRDTSAPMISPAMAAAARVMERIDEAPSLSRLAAMSGLSYSRFIHRFKDEIGESPKAFMIRQRIEKAKHVLRKADDQISDVAYACGFRSINLFISQFKKITGMTPREYRRSK